MTRLLKVKAPGSNAKVHIAHAHYCDSDGASALCETRLRSGFKRAEADQEVTCAWCATKTHLLDEVAAR